MNKSPAMALAAQPLAEHAASGVTTEAALRNQLRSALDAKGATANAESTAVDAPPHSLTARLNAEFSGLLHISHHAKNTADAFTQLRLHLDTQSPLHVLIDDVNALAPDAQKPLADWLRAAQDRVKTDSILAQLETALATTPSTP